MLLQDEWEQHKFNIALHIDKITAVCYYELSPGHVYTGERHNFWELVYCDTESLYVIAGKKRLLLKQGEIIFHKPNEFHALESDGKNPPNIFVLSFNTKSKAMHYLQDSIITILPKFRKLITFIWEESNNAFSLPFEFPCVVPKKDAVFGSEQFVKNYLEQLLLLLIREKLSSRSKQKNALLIDNSELSVCTQVVEVLASNVYNNISVDSLCKNLGFSRQYIGRLFKQEYNTTISNYYRDLKIKEAKKLIRKGEQNFTQIAEMLHFTDSAHFARTFQRTAGVLPIQYKKSIM